MAAVKYDNDGSGEIAAAFAVIQSVRLLKQHQKPGDAFVARDLAGWASGNAELRDALEGAGCADSTNTAKVGYWLRAHKNRIASGLKLTFEQVHGGRDPGRWSLLESAAKDQV